MKYGIRKGSTAFVIALASTLVSVSSAQVLFEDRLETYLTDQDARDAGYQITTLDNLAFGDSMVTNEGVDEVGTDWSFEFSRFRDAPLDANGNRTSAIGDITKQPGENIGVFTGYVMSNSDFGSSNDEGDLNRGYVFTTPPFDASGASNVWLEFATIALLNDGSTDSVFEIWVSTNYSGPSDSDSGWTNVFRRVPHDRQANPLDGDPIWTINEVGGLRGVFNVDLTAQLAGQSQAAVRFINRGAGDSWLISLDDIRIKEDAPGGSVSLLSNESFDGGGALPAGWTTNSNTSVTSPGWTRGDNVDLVVTHHTIEGNAGTSNEVVVNNGPSPADYLIVDANVDGGDVQDEDLITPNVTGISGPGVLYLQFDSEVRVNDDTQETIEISFDDGATWESEPIFRYQKNVDGQEPAVHRHYVPVNITNQTQAKFRFNFETLAYDVDDPGIGGWWSIDNVAVTFEPGAVEPVTPAVGAIGAEVVLDDAQAGIPARTTVFGQYGLNHVRTEIEAITSTGNFSTPDFTLTVDSGDLTAFTLTGLSTLGETYSVRARHVATAIDGQPTEYFSEWSTPVDFTVVARPNAPTFLNPLASIDPQTAQSSGVTFDLDVFSSPDLGQTHTQTSWELIPADGDFNTPILTGTVDTGDLTTFTIPELGIPEQDFTVRVRYEAGPLVSEWTEQSFTVDAPTGLTLLLDEDFSGAELQAAVDEDNDSIGWTDVFPTGWTAFDSNTGDGAVEWDGWALTNLEFWLETAEQDREQFTLSQLGDGIFAVADSDEYDDVRSGGDMDASLVTPLIAAGTGEVQIYYIYSYRFEAPGVAETFLYRGSLAGSSESLVRFDSNGPTKPGETGPSDFTNNVQLHTTTLTEDTNLFVEFRYYGEAPNFLSENDWWYAIDRVKVYGQPGTAPTNANSWNLYQ